MPHDTSRDGAWRVGLAGHTRRLLGRHSPDGFFVSRRPRPNDGHDEKPLARRVRRAVVFVIHTVIRRSGLRCAPR
jgi:hypothetical protein